MADTIIIKYSDTPGNTPTLAAGEIAINRADGILFWKNSSNALKQTKISGYTIVSITSTPYNATQTSGHIILLVDAATAGGNVTINLPTAVGNTAMFTIKKIDSGTNTVTVDANGSQTIDDGLTAVIRVQYESISLISDNANWKII